jgi:hypothetical protein
MLDRAGTLLKLLCLGLAVLSFYQLARITRAGVHPTSLPTVAKVVAAAKPSTNTSSTNISAPDLSPRKDPALPSAIKEQVDKITESEILGMVVRPVPMALLGIAGRDVLLRAPNGQTGLLREGEELGGVKLLQIGTNRVLIEQAGQEKELMIFSGFGSESLLPKEKEKTK